MTFSIIVSFLTYSVIMGFTPGPNNIMALSSTSQYGIRRSVPLLLGMGAGFLAVMLSCAIFTFSVSRLLPNLMNWLTFVGAGYILWLAWRIGTSPVSDAQGAARPLQFWPGFLLQFVNVKVILTGMTALSTFVLPHTQDSVWLVGLSIVLAGIGNAGNWLWALAGRLLQAHFARHGRCINVILAALLVYCVVQMFV